MGIVWFQQFDRALGVDLNTNTLWLGQTASITPAQLTLAANSVAASVANTFTAAQTVNVGGGSAGGLAAFNIHNTGARHGMMIENVGVAGSDYRALNIYANGPTTALGQCVVDVPTLTTGGALWVGTSNATFSNTTTGLAYFTTTDASSSGNVVMIRNEGTGYGLHIHSGTNSTLMFLSGATVTTGIAVNGSFNGLTSGNAISLSTNNAGFTGNGIIAANVASSSATGSALYATQAGSGAAGRFDSSKGYGIDIQSTSTTTAGQRVFMTNQNNNECLSLVSYNAPTGSGKSLTIYGGTNGGTLGASITPTGIMFLLGTATIAGGTATPAGGSTSARLVFGTTAGFGIYYGSGVPTVSAAQGSLYLRSDGSSTTTRSYINTDGGTTWTPHTTGA